MTLQDMVLNPPRLSAREVRSFQLHIEKVRQRKIYELHMQALARIHANARGLAFFKRQA